jgi:pyruvate dehydrogenase E1 component beta subunit
VSERPISFGQATLDAMQLAMREDDRVIVLGEDIGWGGSFGQFRGLLGEFGPERVIDMPISEAQIVSACVGAAVTGLRPVGSISFVEFTMGAMDEIVNQAAKLRYMFGGQVSVPMVLRASDGTLRSSAAQHSESFEAIFAHVPGLKVVAPSTPADAKGLLAAAIADDDPVVYLENKKIGSSRGPVPEGRHVVPIGEAAVRRPGADVTVIAYSIMAHHAEQACEELAEEGVDVELVDLRSLVPLDLETVLASVAKTRRAVVCHEAWRAGGFGAEVAARITEELFDELGAPVARVGARTAHIPFSPPLERAVVPQKEEIVEAVRAVVERAGSTTSRR